MEKEIVCIICPRSCRILASGEKDGPAAVSGFGCLRGEQYATAEFTHPMRILTSTVLVENTGALLPVRSNAPVPKADLLACMDCIKRVRVTSPIRLHETVLANVAGTGVDMIAVKAVK